jgi:hypothetical protein
MQSGFSQPKITETKAVCKGLGVNSDQKAARQKNKKNKGGSGYSAQARKAQQNQIETEVEEGMSVVVRVILVLP